MSNNNNFEKKLYIKRFLGAELIDEEDLGEISCRL
jgi:hypothetical protein